MSCMCVKKHSATICSKTCFAYIYLLKSQPLLFDNCIKPLKNNFDFILINHLALV